MAAAVAVVVLGLLALLGWRVVAADARGDVTVTWSGPVSCTGTTVAPTEPQGGDKSFPAIRLREGMRCTLPVRVTNESRFEVTVTRVRLPFMGPEGGAGVQVSRLDDQEPHRARAVNAFFRLEERLSTGEAYDVDIVFEFRPPPHGCSSENSVTWVRGLPEVTVLALGRPGSRHPEETIGFRGTQDSDC